MANSVDPDETLRGVRSGSTLFAKTYLFHRVITVVLVSHPFRCTVFTLNIGAPSFLTITYYEQDH